MKAATSLGAGSSGARRRTPGPQAAGPDRGRQDIAAIVWLTTEEIDMAINPILAGAGSLPGLDLHPRHKGVHGETRSQSAGDPASDAAPLGTSRHLFSHLLDSSQELIGINPAAAARKP